MAEFASGEYCHEMGLEHRDFFRLLPRAMRDHPYEVKGNQVDAEVFGGKVQITLGPEQERRLTANMALPFCEVTFRYSGLSAEDYDTFRRAFELSFQRGGG